MHVDEEAMDRQAQRSKKFKKSKKKKDKTKIYFNVWDGSVRLVIVDEAHKLRNKRSKFHASVSLLRAPHHWLITATPVLNKSKVCIICQTGLTFQAVNRVQDILGLAEILWPAAASFIEESDEQILDWISKNSKYTSWESASEYNDARRLICMDPKLIEKLLDTTDVNVIAEHYHHLEDLVMIRRTTGSKLRLNHKEDSPLVDLKSMMVPHSVFTVDLEYRSSEAAEAEWWHLLNARSVQPLFRLVWN